MREFAVGEGIDYRGIDDEGTDVCIEVTILKISEYDDSMLIQFDNEKTEKVTYDRDRRCVLQLNYCPELSCADDDLCAARWKDLCECTTRRSCWENSSHNEEIEAIFSAREGPDPDCTEVYVAKINSNDLIEGR